MDSPQPTPPPLLRAPLTPRVEELWDEILKLKWEVYNLSKRVLLNEMQNLPPPAKKSRLD